MAYRFRHNDSSVEAGLRRIAQGEIGKTIAVLDDPDIAAAVKVHKVRAECKKLRALIRLVRPAFAAYARENAAFRDLAGALSGARDAAVLLATFDSLIDGATIVGPPDALTQVRAMLLVDQDELADAEALLAPARAQLVAAQARIARWSLDAQGWAALSGGLATTYKRAHRDYRRVQASPDPAISHDWRKRVKYHARHSQLLRGLAPDRMAGRTHDLKALAELLGNRHDIDVLLAAMADDPGRFGGIVTVMQLAELARQRASDLDRRARALGKRLFDHKTGALAKDWGKRWDKWMAGPS